MKVLTRAQPQPEENVPCPLSLETREQPHQGDEGELGQRKHRQIGEPPLAAHCTPHQEFVVKDGEAEEGKQIRVRYIASVNRGVPLEQAKEIIDLAL